MHVTCEIALLVSDGDFFLLAVDPYGDLAPISEIALIKKCGLRELARYAGKKKSEVGQALDVDILPKYFKKFYFMFQTNAYPGHYPRFQLYEALNGHVAIPTWGLMLARFKDQGCYIQNINSSHRLITKLYTVRFPRWLFARFHKIFTCRLRLVTKEEVAAGITADGILIHSICRQSRK